MSRLSGPNPIKLTEELLENSALRQGSVVCDLGCGKGLTSVFLAKEYGLKVYAVDPLSDPEENRRFFTSQGLLSSHVLPLKTELKDAPVEKEFFDAVVNVGAFNYYGRDDAYLSDEILPYVKHGGYIYIAVPRYGEGLPRRAAGGAFAVMDTGAVSFYARCGILARRYIQDVRS